MPFSLVGNDDTKQRKPANVRNALDISIKIIQLSYSMNHTSFHAIVIDLLDDENGIDEAKFRSLMAFTERNFPDMCTDVFNVVDGAEGRVYLNENVAEELRFKEQSEPNMVQVTKEMAIDAGDRRLDGQWIEWS